MYGEAVRRSQRLFDTQFFPILLAGQQINSPAARNEASDRISALEYDMQDCLKELIRSVLDGALTLALSKGETVATDNLFAQLKNFPREASRVFSSSSRSAVSLSFSVYHPLGKVTTHADIDVSKSPNRSLSPSSLLSPLPLSAPPSPRGSILSELSDAPSDHIYYHSDDKPRTSSSSLALNDLCEEIRDNFSSDARTIPSIEWRKEGGLLNHEYLLIRVCTPGRKDVWMRLERAAKRNFAALRKLNPMSVSSRFAPDDSVCLPHHSDILPIL